MELDPKHGRNKSHVLKLLKNVYSQKQASRKFYIYVSKRLIKLGFQKSNLDKYMFFMQDDIFIIYVDDGIILTKDKSKVDQIFHQVKQEFEVKKGKCPAVSGKEVYEEN